MNEPTGKRAGEGQFLFQYNLKHGCRGKGRICSVLGCVGWFAEEGGGDGDDES